MVITWEYRGFFERLLSHWTGGGDARTAFRPEPDRLELADQATLHTSICDSVFTQRQDARLVRQRNPRRAINAIGSPTKNMCTRIPVTVMYNGAPPPPALPAAESGRTT
jgi:hypothetical protein